MKSFISSRVTILREKLSQSIGLSFAQLLPESLLEKILQEEEVNYRKRLFCPIITLWTWLSQVLDDKTYSLKALAELYGLRWQAELDLRHLKTTMAMEFLPSKTPEKALRCPRGNPARKEFYVHLLAYNLIRKLQCEAGRQHEVLPITLSFKATIQHLSNFVTVFALAAACQRQVLYQQLIVLIAGEKLPYRPNRVEPRVVKRRHKAYQRMHLPRKQLKQKCLNRKIDSKTGKSNPSY